MTHHAVRIARGDPIHPDALTPGSVTATLDNGTAVRALRRDRLPIVDVLLVLPAGAATDHCDTAGRAQLTAELIDAGTTSRSQIDVATGFDALGARLSIHTHWDCIGISLQVLPANLTAALELLADVVQRASFPQAEFERGKAEQLATILQDLDDPESLAASAIARAIFGADHIYGLPRGGTRATVEGLGRDALVQCHAAGYRPTGAHAFIVGDVEPDTAIRELAGAFVGWHDRDLRRSVTLSPTARPARRIHLVDRPGAPQSELRLGTIGAARSSSDYFPLVVLNTILGGAFTSRLNTRLREEGGYTYGAFSAFSFRQYPGPFVVGTAVFSDDTGRALSESLEEIDRLLQEPVPAAELDRTKKYLTLGLARGFERNGGIAARLADVDLYGLGDDYWERYAERIEAVGAETIMESARRYLDPEGMVVAIVGDAATVRSQIESLGMAPVIDTTSE